MRTIAAARVEGHDDRLRACEAAFLGLARVGDLRGLRRATARFRNLARADGREPRVPDGLHLSRSFDARTVLSGEFGDAAAETITNALHRFMDPPSDDDLRPRSQRMTDALVRICQVAVAHTDGAGRGVADANLVIDWPTVTAGTSGRCDGEFTGPIHPDDIRRLLCDCSISRIVTGPASEPLDVGRSRRTIPPPMRRVLVARDDGCRYPGCDRPPGWCDAHHVVHWIEGGPTSVDNLVLLCDRHHHVVHQPGWAVTFDGRDLHVYRPDGREVP